MRIKYFILVAGMVSVAGIFSQPAFAISQAYREQLARSGCTQVSEANGDCDVSLSRSRKYGAESEETERNETAYLQSVREVARELNSHVAGKYQGQAVDYMARKGWHHINEEHTRWVKSGFVVDFDMDSSGRLEGITVE